MFKAIDSRDGSYLISIDARWIEDVRHLRELTRRDILVCQQCRQPLHFKAGAKRRWHFAHKHLTDCPYGTEPAELLQARALLYLRLQKRFGARALIELKLDDWGLTRPVDCWVEGEPGPFAYWIIDHGIRSLAHRELLVNVFAENNTAINWLFMDRMRRAGEQEGLLHLSTTERAFLTQTRFDQALGREWYHPNSSIHFLDPVKETLTTYRGLHLIHEPQEYEGIVHVSALAHTGIAKDNGEFAHTGEPDRWREFREELARRERALAEQQAEVEQLILRRPKDAWDAGPQISPMPAVRTPQPQSKAVVCPARMPALTTAAPSRLGVCRHCGKTTGDWWDFDGKTGTCQCNECRRQERGP